VAPLFLLDEEQNDVEELFVRAASGNGRILVPGLIRIELLNVLASAVRRRRMRENEAERTLHWLNTLPWEIEESPDAFAQLRILHWAEKHHLSAYDAVYLELAERHGAYLKSRDARILNLRPAFSWIRR
jgi:predicted nucleic acid-binding protein